MLLLEEKYLEKYFLIILLFVVKMLLHGLNITLKVILYNNNSKV